MTSLLLMLLAMGVLYWLPGRLLSLLMVADDAPEERLAVSLGLGIVAVNTTAVTVTGLLGFFLPVHLSGAGVAAAGAAWVVGAGGLLWLRRRHRVRELWRRPVSRQVAVWGLTLACTVLFALDYDSTLVEEDSCILRAATAIHLDYGRPELLAAVPEEEASEYHRAALARLKQDRNDFLAHNQGQRLGPAILVAPFLALFGLPGLRLAFVLQGLLLPGLGFVLGCRLLRRPWAAWAAAVLLAVNPWSLGVQVFDENFMASCFGSLMLALLLRERPAWAAAGMSLGLFLGIRHVGVLMVPFLLGFAWWTVRRPRPLLELCGAAALAGLPCAVLHTFLWIQTGTPFEGAIGRPPAQHSFLGLDFDLSVLLNFPFVDEPLRSPYMAWPPLIAFPLDLLRRLGILAAALLPAGIVHIWRREPGSAFLLASWAVPLWLLVMVQSNWIEPNKMGVPAAALAPVVIALVGGAAFLLEGARRAWRRWALWAGTAVAAAGCGALLAGVETTVDERVLSSRPAYLAEIFPKGTALDLAEKPEFPDLDRERHRLRLLPDLPVDTWHPVHVGRRLGQLVRELASPALDAYAGPPVSVLHLAMTGRRQYVGPLSLARSMRRGPGASPWEAFGPCPGAVGEPNGETVTAVVDLSVPPSLSCAPVEVTSGEPGCLDLTPGTARVVRDLAVPWAEEPVVAVVGRSCDGSAYVATGPRGVPGPAWDVRGTGMEEMPAAELPDLRLELCLPVGASLVALEARTIAPTRFYRRYGVAGTDRAWWSAPLPSSH